jgi:ribosome maturation protein Sdo1
VTMVIETHMYEALTEAGVKPDTARKVERQVEAALSAGQEAVRAEMREKLMTKADGIQLKADLATEISAVKTDMAEMESRLLRAMNDQTWKLVSFVVVANGALLAIFKFIG